MAHESVRRVVTGHDAAGKAVFVSDAGVAPFVPSISPGSSFHRIWGADGPPHLPDDGSLPPHTAYFPPVGGFRFGMFTLPPAGEVLPEGLDIGAAVEEMRTALPGMLEHIEPDDPGMHTTSTVDFEVVLAGEVVLELDDGVEVTLGVGDTVVQNGTRHRWHNRRPEPATLAVFLVGAHHDRVP